MVLPFQTRKSGDNQPPQKANDEPSTKGDEGNEGEEAEYTCGPAQEKPGSQYLGQVMGQGPPNAYPHYAEDPGVEGEEESHH